MRQQFVTLAVETAQMVARNDESADLHLAERASEIFGADGGVGVCRWVIKEDGTPDISVAAGGIPPMTPEWFPVAKRIAPGSPSIQAVLRAGVDDVARVSDLGNLRRLWGTEEFGHLHGLYGGRYPVGAALLQRPDALVLIGLHRTKRDFDDDDLANLRLMQGILAQAFSFRRTLDEAVDRITRPSGIPRQRHVLPWVTLPASEYPPTQREAEVLALVADGWTNGQIATRLGITERTVRKHLGSVYEQAGVRGRAAAAAWWQERVSRS